MDALSIPTAAELESLVTTAIYSSLITARLSPASNPPTVNVTSVAPLRDVKPDSLSTMITILTNWETRCSDVTNDLEAEIEKIKADAVKRRSKEQAHAALLEKAVANYSPDADGAGFGGPGMSRKSNRQSRTGGRRLGRSGAGGSGSIGNKREFSADDNDDDGYFENGSDGLFESNAAGSRMDIDEGVGSSSRSAARQAKRLLGKKS